MNVRNIQRVLESVAPLAYAESWDNVGLLIGDPASRVRKLMLCIDLTEAVLAEALAAKATMVMAYHPILFKDLKKLTADAAPVVYRAARKGIAVYSMHTALDVAPGGTNDVLADVLGLADVRPLEATMQQGRCQIVTFVPADDLDAVATAAFDAGAAVHAIRSVQRDNRADALFAAKPFGPGGSKRGPGHGHRRDRRICEGDR